MAFIAGAAWGGRLAATFDVFGLILQAGIIVQLVLLLLAAFSIISWAIIVFKWRELSRAEQDSEAFLEIYHDDSLHEAYEAAGQLDRSPLSGVFLSGCHEIQRRAPRQGPIDVGELGSEGVVAVGKRLQWAADRESRRLERGLSFLATTGSSAPFIGLFGTVVGIIQAFQGIAAAGSASLAVVAPGIAEALVATAVGLVAAIPATIFFNVFVGRAEGVARRVELFREEFHRDVARLAGGRRAGVRPTGSEG